jgi:chloramphenicol 3-O-phosphotransferase
LHVHTKPALFEGVDGGQAVVINGASGAGKSTLMQAIQARAGGPWVVFDEPEQLGTVPPEYLIWREQAPTLHHGYLAAIASLARAGNYVTVPAGHAQAELADHLAGIPTLWVGLHCDRSVLLQRERRQGRTAKVRGS